MLQHRRLALPRRRLRVQARVHWVHQRARVHAQRLDVVRPLVRAPLHLLAVRFPFEAVRASDASKALPLGRLESRDNLANFLGCLALCPDSCARRDGL